MLTNSTVIESKRMKNSEGKYHKLIYSGYIGIFYLTIEQYYWVINDTAYILTFTSEQRKFADFRKIGEKILNSFILR